MLELDDNYFKEEERCGFKIPSMMKRAWAVEMELTCELLNICSQYGLRIYASWGTLLGAVRHKGFIPWDDDMDFDMPREDYMKLMDILKHKDIYTDFYVSSLYTEGTHCQPSATIMNYYKIPLPSEIQNKFYNFPYVAGIDINPMDYVPRDKEFAETQLLIYGIIYDVAQR